MNHISISAQLAAYQKRVMKMRLSPYINFPAHVHIETKCLCNASCNFCPYSSLDRKGTTMEDALIEKLTNDLCDIPQTHKFQLSPFKVNEPFLDSRLFDLLSLFYTRLPNASITLTTNASPISNKMLAELSTFKNIGYLWISFNDHRPIEYEKTMQLSYKNTLEKLQMIHNAKANQQLTTRIVISRVSDGSLDDRSFALWVKSHFPLFEVCLFPKGDWIGQVALNKTAVPAVGCARWFDLSITSTGVVAHCCMDGKAEFPIGNVRNSHILEIYNNTAFRKLREKLNTRLEAEPCCRCGFL